MNDTEQFAYITVSNSKRLVNSFDLRSYADANYSVYKRDVRSVLSMREIARISLLQEIYRTKGAGIFESVDTKFSSRRLAFGPKPPAFHKNEDCQFLFSSYVNLEIPVEIEDRGEEEIAKFKSFCEEHRSLFSTSESRFMLKLEARFLLKNRPKRIEHANSGVFEDRSSLDTIIFSIEKLLDEAQGFRERDRSTRDEIDRNGNETHRMDSTKIEGSILNIWHYKYKLELKKMLEEYSRLSFNPENMFDETMLKKLDFRTCSSCGVIPMKRTG